MKKVFMTIVLLIFSLTLFGVPNKSVKHKHNGRSHTHPLPKTGLNHSHNKATIPQKKKQISRGNTETNKISQGIINYRAIISKRKRLKDFTKQEQKYILMVAKYYANKSSGVTSNICETKIDKDKDDIIWLENDAIAEISSGYLGYIGYRKNALLIKNGTRWKLFIEGKKVYNVDLLKSPSSCRAPSTYQIEAAVRDEIFIINSEKFKAQTYCLGWEEGHTVVFTDGGEYGACTSANLFNVNTSESCEVWCE